VHSRIKDEVMMRRGMQIFNVLSKHSNHSTWSTARHQHKLQSNEASKQTQTPFDTGTWKNSQSPRS